MADLNKIVEDLSSLTVLEAAELSKLLEEKWGVSAAAPVAVSAAPAAGSGEAAAEEKTEFDIELSEAGSNKIAVIKETRQFEERVSCTPEIVKKFINLGFKVSVQSEAGISSSYFDSDYKSSGAEVVKSEKTLLSDADLIFAIVRPDIKLLKLTSLKCLITFFNFLSSII